MGYNPNIAHLCVDYKPFTNHSLTFWDIQVLMLIFTTLVLLQSKLGGETTLFCELHWVFQLPNSSSCPTLNVRYIYLYENYPNVGKYTIKSFNFLKNHLLIQSVAKLQTCLWICCPHRLGEMIPKLAAYFFFNGWQTTINYDFCWKLIESQSSKKYSSQP